MVWLDSMMAVCQLLIIGKLVMFVGALARLPETALGWFWTKTKDCIPMPGISEFLEDCFTLLYGAGVGFAFVIILLTLGALGSPEKLDRHHRKSTTSYGNARKLLTAIQDDTEIFGNGTLEGLLNNPLDTFSDHLSGMWTDAESAWQGVGILRDHSVPAWLSSSSTEHFSNATVRVEEDLREVEESVEKCESESIGAEEAVPLFVHGLRTVGEAVDVEAAIRNGSLAAAATVADVQLSPETAFARSLDDESVYNVQHRLRDVEGGVEELLQAHSEIVDPCLREKVRQIRQDWAAVEGLVTRQKLQALSRARRKW
ncbi:hypothetical protein LTR37_014093 [Vermiconidia calcicola]|uniref:Uncharacterized protein n=1 Tax=Vermiconidia calcicola TaxID=1690605 RepID=A0ACC3MW52_9PEZI|nr:hypothetical protein LTR37_014093 [Vermiconidia calcicola]